jgi:hypothetical protein
MARLETEEVVVVKVEEEEEEEEEAAAVTSPMAFLTLLVGKAYAAASLV